MNEQPASIGSNLPAAQIARRFVNLLRETQCMPRDRMPDYQRGLLEPLIRHARAHVPFYRDTRRLDPLFRPDDSIDWKRWNDIPLLSRREVQAAGAALHAEKLGPEHGSTWTLTTSGSTGEPVRVLHSRLSGEVVWASLMLRGLEWHGLNPRQRFTRVGPFTRVNPPLLRPRVRKAWYPPFEWLELLGDRLDVPESLPLSEIAEGLMSFRPDCLSINPIQLELLLSWDERRTLRKLGAITVMTSADRLPDSVKELAATEYDWRIMNIYASNECGLMAISCPHCNQFHINAEAMCLEFMDEPDEPSDGRLGWIVATPLYNYAMPLIRYDHADQAERGEEGTCRITLPSLKSVVGKEPITFVFGDVTVRPVLPPSQIIEYLGARAFQVAQISDDCCEFRIVPGNIAPSDMRFDDMTRLIRAKWWSGLNINYKIVDEFPGQGSRRKTIFYVCEIADRRNE